MISRKALVLGAGSVLSELAATDTLAAATAAFGDVSNNVLTTAGQQALKVATVAALLALPFAALNDGYAVDLLGYAQAGDGGGGAIRWSAASTATVDGGLVFGATGNTGAGRWLRCLDGKRPSSRMFGTLGQGADETYQLQAFLNAGGGALSPPLNAGQPYIVGNPASNAPAASVASLWVPSGCQVIGDSSVTIQQVRPAGQSSPIFSAMMTARAQQGAQDITLAGGWKLDLNAGGAAQPTINSGNPIWGTALLFRASYSSLADIRILDGWDNCLTVGDHGTDAENAYNAVAFAGDVTNDSATVANVTNVGQLAVNQFVTGAGIPAATFIQSIAGTTITLSNVFTGATASQQALQRTGTDLSYNTDVVARGLRTYNGGCGVHTAYVPNALLGLSGNGIDVTNCFAWHGSDCIDRGSGNSFGFDTGGQCSGTFLNCTSILARLDPANPTNGSGIGFASGQNGTQFIGCKSFYAGLYAYWFPTNKPNAPYTTPTLGAADCYGFFSGAHNYLINGAAQLAGCVSQDAGQLCGFNAVATAGSTTLTGVTNTWFLAQNTGVGNPLALITGPGIPSGTYITGVDPNSAHIVISQAPTSGDGVTSLGGFAVPPQFDGFRVQATFTNIVGYDLAACRDVDDIGHRAYALREVASTGGHFGDGGVYTVSGTVTGIDPALQPVLVLDSTKTKIFSASTTPDFSSVPASHNWLINPSFAVNQRGYASGGSLANNVYGHDRWKSLSTSSYTFAQAAGGDTTVTISGAIGQVIDAPNVTEASVWVTWAGSSPLYVAQNGTVLVNFVAGTPYTVNGQAINGVLVTGLTVGAPLTIGFGAGTLARPQVAHVSSTFMPPGYARRQFGEEVYLCQRYYYSFSASGQDLFTTIASGSTTLVYNVRFPSNMRATPTCTVAAGTSGTFASGMPSVSGTSTDHASLRGDTSSLGAYSYLTGFTASAEL